MTTFNLPDLGEGLPEAEIVTWHVKTGDRIAVDEPLLAVETAKAVVEVPSPFTGTVKALHAKAGDIVATGAPLVEFDVEGSATPTPPPATPKTPAHKIADDSGTVVGSMPATREEEYVEQAVAGSQRNAPTGRVRAAPAVRALAKRLGVDLAVMHGSGRAGLVTVDDVMNQTRSAAATMASAPVSSTRAPAANPAVTIATGEPEKLRGARRAMAHSMSLARDQIAASTIFDDADIHHWLHKGDYTARLMRALGMACRVEPALNAWYDAANNTRTLLKRVDLAVAVDTPEGLFVPVVRDIGAKNLAAMRAALKNQKEAAHNRSVTPEDLRDFTLMLSNFGTLAGRYATPVVVPPAVAILGAGCLRHDVVAVMGGIEAHLRMPLSLSFDHRCVTGGEACRFLAAVIADLQRAE